MVRRILFLSQWFEPEYAPRGLKFVQELIAHGYEVEVATGFPNYPTGRIATGYRLKPYQLEVMEGVRVNRLYLYPSHDRSTLGRTLNYLSFSISAFLFCMINGKKFDAVYVYHPPITVGLAAALSGLVNRRPFLIDIQDLWPDSVAASGMSGAKMLSRVLDPICRFVYRRAAFVTGQSNAMTARLVERGVPRDNAATSFNWADEEAARSNGRYDVSGLGFEGRFNFVYGGNLGAVQGLDVLIKAADLAAEKAPEIQLTLIGEGVEREKLSALIAGLGTASVRIHPAVNQSQTGDVFAAADVLVAHLIDNPLFEITIPSKTQFYMAMGKPILMCVRGESATIVATARAGFVAPPERVEAIADAMIQMSRLSPEELHAMGARGKAEYDARFSFASAVSATAVRLDRLVCHAHRP